MKKIFSILKWLVVTLMALILIVVLINLRDEPLDPAVAALMAERAPDEVTDNAYVYLLGMSSAEGDDPYRAGEKKWRALIEADKAGTTLNESQAAGLPMPRIQDSCNPLQENCLATAAGQNPARSTDRGSDALLASRCEQLLRFPVWQESYVPTSIKSTFTDLRPLSSCQLIRFAKARSDRLSGNTDAALNEIIEGLEFERRVLAGSVTLVSKQVALAAMLKSLLTLSDLTAVAPEASRRKPEAVRAALRPLYAQERSQEKPLKNEFRLSVRLVLAIKDEPETAGGWREALFFNPKATINESWRIEKIWLSLDATPASGFEAARTHIDAQIHDRVSGFTPAVLYNPFGRWLATNSTPDLSKYIARMHDLDGVLRLTGLQAELAISPDGEVVANLLEQPRFADLYTGRPMNYDVSEKRLSFKLHSDLANKMKDSPRLIEGRLSLSANR